MASIAEWIQKIKTAIYGEEVRGAIWQSLQAMNDELTSADVTQIPVNKADIANLRTDMTAVQGSVTTQGAELADIRIGADGTTYGNAGTAVRTQIGDLKEEIDYIGIEKTLCKASENPSDYDSGVEGFTYAYLLNNDGEPLVIPKGGKIKKFRCVTPSAATHAINIFFMKRVLNGYSLVFKLENVDITGNKYIDLSDLEFSTRCYIAVSNVTNYALRYKTTPVSGATVIRNLVGPVADIGETKTAVFAQASERYYAFDIDILKPTDPITYEVGVGKDFTCFTTMLRALKNDTDEKIVYIDGGVYDIYVEKGGASYLASITDPSSVNWRDVCEVIPDNTTIIGVGKVILRWNPTDSAVGSDAKAFLFSPLNVSGSCRIENIEIECTNCRYAIHDETSGISKWNNVRHIYKGVKVKKVHGAYGNAQLYAAGIAPNGTYLFEDCHFESDQNWMFSMHTTPMGEADKVTVTIKDCTLIRTGTSGYQNTDMVGFGNTHTVKRYADVTFNNCWLNGNIMLYAEGNMANAVNAYAVRTVGCNAVSININGVTNEQPIMQKNVFSNY